MMISVEHYETREVQEVKDVDGRVLNILPIEGSGEQGLILKSHRGEVKIPLTKERLDQYIDLFDPVLSGYEPYIEESSAPTRFET